MAMSPLFMPMPQGIGEPAIDSAHGLDRTIEHSRRAVCPEIAELQFTTLVSRTDTRIYCDSHVVSAQIHTEEIEPAPAFNPIVTGAAE
jgi:hypothetical protein